MCMPYLSSMQRQRIHLHNDRCRYRYTHLHSYTKHHSKPEVLSSWHALTTSWYIKLSVTNMKLRRQVTRHCTIIVHQLTLESSFPVTWLLQENGVIKDLLFITWAALKTGADCEYCYVSMLGRDVHQSGSVDNWMMSYISDKWNLIIQVHAWSIFIQQIESLSIQLLFWLMLNINYHDQWNFSIILTSNWSHHED